MHYEVIFTSTNGPEVMLIAGTLSAAEIAHVRASVPADTTRLTFLVMRCLCLSACR